MCVVCPICVRELSRRRPRAASRPGPGGTERTSKLQHTRQLHQRATCGGDHMGGHRRTRYTAQHTRDMTLLTI